MTPTPLSAALATLRRAIGLLEAPHADRLAARVALANFNAAFDAVEVLKAAARPAPRF